jgi:hypothetical protein
MPQRRGAIERNPLEAGIVVEPWDYDWSSARVHATGAADPLVAESAEYHELASDFSVTKQATKVNVKRHHFRVTFVQHSHDSQRLHRRRHRIGEENRINPLYHITGDFEKVPLVF